MTFADVVRFDKKREQEYSQFSLKQDASDLRFIAAIVIVVLTGLTLVDLFRGTDFRVVFFVRLLVIFAHVALLIIASQKTIGPSVLQTASFVASFILSGSYFILDRYGSMPQYFFTNGIVIVNFLICTVSSLRFRFSALFSVSLVVSFLLYYPTSPHSLYQKTQITNIVIGLILSIIIGFILERHKRINFWQQTQLNKIMAFCPTTSCHP